MPDFSQQGPITTLHDLGTLDTGGLEGVLTQASEQFPLGLLLLVTASDMRAEQFQRIVDELAGAEFLDTILVVLNRAPEVSDYQEAARRMRRWDAEVGCCGRTASRGAALHQELISADFNVTSPGKGRAVWTGFGFLLADPRLKAFALHDCDIVDYERDMLVRLCLPMAHPALDFDYCKAYYARCTDRMHGRVARLLVMPLVRALIVVLGHDPFLTFLGSFRYPLAGEFAITLDARPLPADPQRLGAGVGTLAEVYRNTSPKRVCQVDIGRLYEHKHQPLSLDNPKQGLMKMAADILSSVFRTLAAHGMVLESGHFVAIRAAYLRVAQDAIRQYHADALMNTLAYDRHAEERAVEGFARKVSEAGAQFLSDPEGGAAMPTWARVLAAFPDFPERLRRAAAEDADQHGG